MIERVRQFPRVLLGLAGAGYAVAFAVVVLFETPGLALSHVFYMPICLVALATDGLWGAGAGALAAGLFALAAAVEPAVADGRLSATAVVVRLVAYCGVGMVVGSYAQGNRRLVVGLREDASRDFLTGVGNTRAFDERLARRCASGRPFTLVLADLDGLKALNDEHGHAAGNEALRRVAELLREQAGIDGEVARIGGDEFALLTRRTGDAADRLCRRLAISLAERGLRLSLGAASAPADGTDPAALFRTADERLFAAKPLARNRRAGLVLAAAE